MNAEGESEIFCTASQPVRIFADAGSRVYAERFCGDGCPNFVLSFSGTLAAAP
ncbi:MAG TPA: hypothetical protein VLW85_16720 [Myxococcales bacterium]|nr:hypothetical protein [Myxococcales bacterium]